MEHEKHVGPRARGAENDNVISLAEYRKHREIVGMLPRFEKELNALQAFSERRLRWVHQDAEATKEDVALLEFRDSAVQELQTQVRELTEKIKWHELTSAEVAMHVSTISTSLTKLRSAFPPDIESIPERAQAFLARRKRGQQ